MVATSPNKKANIVRTKSKNEKGYDCELETITYEDGTTESIDYIYYDNNKYIQYGGWAQRGKHSIKYINTGKLTARAKTPDETVASYHAFVKKNHVHVGINQLKDHETFVAGEEFCIVTVNGVKIGFSESTNEEYLDLRNEYIDQLKSGYELKH